MKSLPTMKVIRVLLKHLVGLFIISRNDFWKELLINSQYLDVLVLFLTHRSHQTINGN